MTPEVVLPLRGPRAIKHIGRAGPLFTWNSRPQRLYLSFPPNPRKPVRSRLPARLFAASRNFAMRLPQHILRNRILTLATALTLYFISSSSPAADTLTGAQVYKAQCARCHGKSGEGTDDNYPDPLEGDKSVAQLTKLIHETMPDDSD